MPTDTVVPTTHIKSSLKIELKPMVLSDGTISGSDIATTLKTIAGMDYGLRIVDLPDGLINIYGQAKLEPDSRRDAQKFFVALDAA